MCLQKSLKGWLWTLSRRGKRLQWISLKMETLKSNFPKPVNVVLKNTWRSTKSYFRTPQITHMARTSKLVQMLIFSRMYVWSLSRAPLNACELGASTFLSVPPGISSPGYFKGMSLKGAIIVWATGQLDLFMHSGQQDRGGQRPGQATFPCLVCGCYLLVLRETDQSSTPHSHFTDRYIQITVVGGNFHLKPSIWS